MSDCQQHKKPRGGPEKPELAPLESSTSCMIGPLLQQLQTKGDFSATTSKRCFTHRPSSGGRQPLISNQLVYRGIPVRIRDCIQFREMQWLAMAAFVFLGVTYHLYRYSNYTDLYSLLPSPLSPLPRVPSPIPPASLLPLLLLFTPA